jgi:3-phenylpropionate/trans-cinnamate dioxygenase ferredoxin reductase subunit
VVVDEYCRSNLPDVYAAGDVANWWHPWLGERLRVEHYDHAGDQGVAAARSMLGKGTPYAPVPYFWSEQYDLNIQLAGFPHGYDQLVMRGSVEENSWSLFYLKEGQFRAALSVNRFKDLSPTRRLLAQRIPVTAEQLADESVELKGLLKR